MGKTYDEKLKNLILYVLSHPEYREGGIKKLNKLLYFIDFYFYRNHERQISNAIYAKASMGPVLDNYQTLFKELVHDGVVLYSENEGRIMYTPIEQCNLNTFTGEEIDHIGYVLARYGRLGPGELEDISHRQQPWLLTEKFGDPIDPDLALLIGNLEFDEESITIENEEVKKELINLANHAE